MESLTSTVRVFKFGSVLNIEFRVTMFFCHNRYLVHLHVIPANIWFANYQWLPTFANQAILFSNRVLDMEGSEVFLESIFCSLGKVLPSFMKHGFPTFFDISAANCFCYVVLLSYCLSISRPIKVMLCGSDVLESFNATKTTGERIWSDEEIEVRGIDESMFSSQNWFLHWAMEVILGQHGAVCVGRTEKDLKAYASHQAGQEGPEQTVAIMLSKLYFFVHCAAF